MNAKKLFVNALLMGAVAAAPVGLSSCDDDDGGGGPSEPDVSEGEASVQLTGDAEATITNATSTITEQEAQGQAVTNVNFTGQDGNNVSISVNAIGETGTYSANPQDGEGAVQVVFNGDQWQSEGGEIGISTNNENRIAGTLNDVQISPAQGDGSVTLNGGFDLAKDGSGGGGLTANQIVLTGAAEDTLSLNQATVTNPDMPVEHRAVSGADASGNSLTVQIVPRDAGTGELSVVTPSSLVDSSTNNAAAVTVTYGGGSWTSTGNGNLNVSTNNSNAVEATVNDIELESGGNNVTINGTINTEQ